MSEPRPDWMPLDPDATPAQQALLDEANTLLLTLRTLEAGERLTGRRSADHDAAEQRINERLDAIREELA